MRNRILFVLGMTMSTLTLFGLAAADADAARVEGAAGSTERRDSGWCPSC